MAGLPWFKVYSNIVAHPKTRALEESLGNPEALAFIVRLLSWFSAYAPNGRTARGRRADGARTARVIERACEWRGESGALVAALVEIGWLDQEGDELVLHDWDEVQGAHLKKAAKDAERKRIDRLREKKAKEAAPDVGADGARTARGRRADGARTARVEESRGEESRGDLPQPPQAAQADLLTVPKALPPTPAQLQAMWNRIANRFGLERWEGMSDKRRGSAQAALDACPELSRWEAWLECLFSSNRFFLGENERGWKADVKWLLKVENRDKVLDFDPDSVGDSAQAPDDFAPPSRPVGEIPYAAKPPESKSELFR